MRERAGLVVNAGDLDRRVTLLGRARGEANAFGEVDEAWGEMGSVWAQKLEVQDAERIKAQAVGVAISLRLRVRWSSVTAAVTRGGRVRLGLDTFSVVEIKELGRREGLEWTCYRIDESMS